VYLSESVLVELSGWQRNKQMAAMAISDIYFVILSDIDGGFIA
tara:strand:- start:1076 stop:1204 length:129 start_codon:yes stop_codon:yes gene_type:complete